MENRFGLKAVENQNEFTEQAIEPKRQFETQLDTPLTMGEYNALNNIYQNSDDKERDVIRFGQALEYKRNFGIDIDYAFNNLPSLNEMRGIPQEYNWSTFSAIKNSFKISALNDKLADLNSQWMDADMAGSDLTELEKQIADTENQIEGLRDYAPRSLLTNMMKWAGESSVFTGVTMLDSLTYGAGTALTLAGFAALMGAPITATAIGGAMTWAGISSLSAGMAKLGGTISVANKTKGTMYRELRKQGVEKNLAKSASSINGYVNGLIETSLGVVPAGVGSVLKATGVEQLTATTMARLAMRGTWGAMGKMLANHVVDSVEEGEEEFLQSLTDDITDAIVLTMSEECQKNGVTFDKSVRDVVTDALKAGGQGFGAALIMSVPSTAVNTRIGVKAAKQLKAEAKINPSEESFVRNHMNDEAFEGVDKKDVKEMLREMYQNQNEVPADERIDESTIDSDTIEENVDIESEEDEAAVASEAPEKDIERMENGRLRTQEEKDYDVDLEGNEKHTLKVGTPNSSTRYGRVEYTVKKDGSIEIDKVATKAGYAKSVTKDAVLELMRRYAGQDVVWNPTNAYQQKIKTELENENNGTLQRFKSQYNQSEEAELGDYLHEKYKQITPSQGKILYKLYDNIAKAYGSTIHEMIQDARSGNPKSALRFATMAEGVKSGAIKAENAVGKRGAVDYANRIIYVGEHGDITTLFHEGFHILTKVDKEGAKDLVKSILESKELEGYIKSHRAFFVPQLSMTTEDIMKALSNLSEDSAEWTEDQDEILTSLFEAYLRNGKTFSKELENIFSRIADFFIQIYKTLAGGKHLSDDIIKAFDQILEGNPELKAKYEAQEGTRFQSPSPEERAEANRQYNEVVAKYKGTDQWLKAPNGQPTKLTERQWVQVRTPNFKAWFGDWENDPQNASKVVDENGEPKVVYHGTPNKVFDVFDVKKVGDNFEGVDIDYNFFFTASEAAAKGYGNVIPVFLNIRNPHIRNVEISSEIGDVDGIFQEIIEAHDFGSSTEKVSGAEEGQSDGLIMTGYRIDDKSLEEINERYKEATKQEQAKVDELEKQYTEAEKNYYAEREKGIKDYAKKWNEQTGVGEKVSEQIAWMSFKDEMSPEVVKAKNELTEIGRKIDAIRKPLMEVYDRELANVATTQDNTANVYAVNEPTQIKSATDNVGTFSQSNPSILFQTEAEAEETGKALYTINKEAKRYRDLKKALYDYNHDMGATQELADELGFAYEDGELVVYSEYDERITEHNVDDYIDEAIKDLRGAETEENQDDIESYTEDIENYESIKKRFKDIKNAMATFKEREKALYDLKDKVIKTLNPETVEYHKFKGGDVRPLYRIGNFTFHGEELDELPAGATATPLEEISAENTLEDKMSVEQAESILNKLLTPTILNQTDTEYLDAVNSGDMAKAQAMVDQRAREMGYTIKAYHGTPLSRSQITPDRGWYVDENGENKYRRQKPPFTTFKGGAYNGLIFFTQDRVKAKEIADNRSMAIPDDQQGREQWTEEGYVYEVYLKTENPFNVTDTKTLEEILDEISEIKAYDFYSFSAPYTITKEEALKILQGNDSWRVAEQKEFLDAIRNRGYDALVAKDEGVEYIAVFNPNQAKSTDPVTYDDNGQVIPLSKRFDASHTSLLFQSAYHGSGASFDKFDTKFIGTGEGAQAFGWGIYLSQSEGISRSYAEKLRGKMETIYRYSLDGKELPADVVEALNNNAGLYKTTEDLRANLPELIKLIREDADKAEARETKNIHTLVDFIDSHPTWKLSDFRDKADKNIYLDYLSAREWAKDKTNKVSLENIKEAALEQLENLSKVWEYEREDARLLETIDANKIEVEYSRTYGRNLYTVSIPDDTGSNYLYWDKVYNADDFKKVHEDILNAVDDTREIPSDFKAKKKQILENEWQQLIDENALTGAAIYGAAEQATLDPKKASMIMADNGFVGIDYPANSMSGGNKYGKRNFVIFNADDINIQTHIRYQNRLTEDERSQLVEEARDFDTFDDFLNYLSIMNGWLEPEQYTDALPVLDEIYSEAHGFTRDKQKVELDLSGMTDDQKDRAFEEYIDGDGIKVIMSLLHDMYTTHYGYTYAHGALEDEEIAEEESLMARIREFEDNASSFIYNLAKSKKELTDKQLDSIRNVIKKNTRMYRELIADTLESETLRSDAEPDIAGTRSEGRPTLSDRENLEKDAKVTLDDKVEGEIEKKLTEVESELDKDEKAARALESEIDSLMGELKGELTEEEQKALKNIQFLERFRGRKDQFAEALKKKIDNGETISQAENTRLDNLAKQIKELEKALDNFNTKQKAKNYIDKQNALKKLRKKIREKQKQKRALKEMHEYKGRLVKYLQKKVPKSVAYEYKGMIEAIISMFSDVSGYDNNITYRGKSVTPKEFREAVDRDGSLDELSKYYIRRYEKKSLADYTVEELEHMADVKRRLVDVGRQMWQAKVDARNAEAAQIRQIILNHLRQSPKFSTAPLPDTQEDKKGKKTFRKKFNELFTRTIPMSRITQMLDGNQKGFVYELLTRDKRLVQDMERLAVRERINKVKNLMEELGVKNEDFYQTAELSIRQSDDLFPDSNIEKFTDTYTLSQLIYGLYAQKNARNRLAFMFGDLVTQDDKAALNHNNDLIYDLGMKRNDRFVKQAEAILEKHPKLRQVAEAIVSDWQDMNNKTRLNQVMIDEYNQGLDMEEFYMPIKRLDFNGTSLAQSIADDVFNQNAGKGMTTPKKGMTFARIDITPDQQMRTNMDFLELWLNSVDEQEHLIATNAYVRKLNRVFKGRGSNDLRSAIENVYGKHINEDIDKYINEIANPPATMEDRNVSKWIRFLRGRLYEAYLGFKLSSFVLQVITSPAPFLREVNAISLSEYILKVMAKPSEYWKFIAERSPMMESRSIDPMLADIKKEAEDATANKFVRGYRKTLAFGTGLLEVADRWMVSAGWLACFEKAMNERQEAINDGTMTQMQAEVEASRYADEVVLESQPTGDSTELSPMFKTGSAAWQALTQFTTSLNVIWTNLMYDSISDLRNRNFKRAILTAFAYALAGTVLYAVQDYEPPEDDEHWIKDTILKLLYGMTSQGFSSVPLIGSGIEKFSKQLFTGEKQLMTQRVFPAFETTREALERLAQGKMDEKTVRKAIEAIGLFTGFPVSGTKELEHIFRDRNGNWRYKGKRITDNDILNWIMAEKWQSVVGRRDNYGNKQRRK